MRANGDSASDAAHFPSCVPSSRPPLDPASS
jgi:hypothetical protein